MKPISLLIVAVAGCAGARATPAPAFVGERFPRPAEISVADSAMIQITPVPPLNYPVGARGMEVSLGTLAVVDTAGRVEMPSVTFITETPPMFRAAVCEYLSKTRFVRARRNGTPHRAVLVGGWVFTRRGGALDGRRLDSRAIVNSIRQRGFAAYVPELDTLPHCDTK